jgi:amino acid adenylation domain-containing protein
MTIDNAPRALDRDLRAAAGQAVSHSAHGSWAEPPVARASAASRAPSRLRGWSYAPPRTLATIAAPLSDSGMSSILAGLLALLQRYGHGDQIAIEVALLGRSAQPLTARLHMELDEEAPFAELRERAHAALQRLSEGGSDPAAAGEHVALTFARSAADARPAHDIAPFAHDHGLHFVVLEAKQGVALLLAYDGSRFDSALVERMLESFAVLLDGALSYPDRALHALPLISSAQLYEVKQACEGSASEPLDELVHEQFARCARREPHAVAVRHRDRTISYRELDERSTKLAHHLVALGVTRESMVAVCLLPSFDVLVALLAIMKAGAIYVPLDPTHPKAMVASIVDEVKPELVLTQQALSASFAEHVRCFCFDRDWAAVAHACTAVALGRSELEQACYVLYTSGTTGRPKGVVGSHRNLAHYLRVARRRYGFRSDDVFCSLARYTFSISFFELLSPLSCGGQLVLLDRDEVLDPARLATHLDEVTVLHAGPSLLGSLFRYLNKHAPRRLFPNLRHASSGGDNVPPALLEQMKQKFCAAELFVIYGCTEISCMGTTAEVDRTRKLERTSVGKPFDDVTLLLLDARGNVVPLGVVGEVYFAGRGVARRYLKRPELSSEKFVCIDGQRFYRTGDLGRLAADGQLELIGRRDFQVQLRGIRIELLGIEQTMLELGLAAQCAVVALPRDEQELCLVACVVEPREREIAALRRALATRLPDYMVPQAFVVLDALPLTPNGKLDRLRLLELAASAPTDASAAESRAWAPPESATERAVAEQFAALLELPRVGRDGDFFELGGHSLSALQLCEGLGDRLGRSVSPALIFEHTSVCALAAALDAAADTQASPILLNQSAELPALFMLLGVHLYRSLAEELAEHYAVYGVYAAGELALLSQGAALCSVVELAREYVAIIRRQQPHGPYRLGGMSFGGLVAYEVAQQLEAAGEEVELLLLIDSVMPQGRVERLRRLLDGAAVGELAHELVARLRRRAPGAASEFMAHADDRALRPLEELRQHAYRIAAKHYARDAAVYRGEVTLVVAGERLARDRLLDPACGFAPLVSNLTVHNLPVDHLALLEAPAVSALARLLLRDARRPGGRRCVVPTESRSTLLDRVA